MSTYDLEEQEQIATVKAWWTQYGNLVITVVVAISLAIAAVFGWRAWQVSQASQASAIYGDLRKAAGARDVKQVRDLGGALLEQFPDSAYAPLAAFVSTAALPDNIRCCGPITT